MNNQINIDNSKGSSKDYKYLHEKYGQDPMVQKAISDFSQNYFGLSIKYNESISDVVRFIIESAGLMQGERLDASVTIAT
jgi:hypothetical protein